MSDFRLLNQQLQTNDKSSLSSSLLSFQRNNGATITAATTTSENSDGATTTEIWELLQLQQQKQKQPMTTQAAAEPVLLPTNILIAVSTSKTGFYQKCPQIAKTWAHSASLLSSFAQLQKQPQSQLSPIVVDVEYYHDTEGEGSLAQKRLRKKQKRGLMMGVPTLQRALGDTNTKDPTRIIDLITTLGASPRFNQPIITTTSSKEEEEQQSQSSVVYDWVFISSDDVYVDVEQLVSFVGKVQQKTPVGRTDSSSSSDEQQYAFYGVPTTLEGADGANGGMVCKDIIKGGGYLLSRATVTQLAANLNVCESTLLSSSSPAAIQDPAYFLPLCAQKVLKVDCESLPVYQNATANFARIDNSKMTVPVMAHSQSGGDGVGGSSRSNQMARATSVTLVTAVVYNGIETSKGMAQLHSILFERSQVYQFGLNIRNLAPWQNRFTFPAEYVLDGLDSQYTNYGFESTSRVRGTENTLRRSMRLLYKLPDTKKDNEAITLRRCVNCRDTSLHYTWYVASHAKGYLTAKINDRTGDIRHLQSELIVTTKTGEAQRVKKFDILIPVKGHSKRLIRLLLSIYDSLQQINKHRKLKDIISVQVLMSAHPDDEWMTSTKEGSYMSDIRRAFSKVLRSTGTRVLNRHDTLLVGDMAIKPVPCNYYDKDTTGFERTLSSNILLDNACRDDHCIVSLMDVDLVVSPSFFINALSVITPSTSVYFPIMYSKFNPETVELVERELQQNPVVKNVNDIHKLDHGGHYRPTSYGMWAMAGSDAAQFRLHDEFRGWGGEDNAFYGLVRYFRNIVRMNEPGLTHMWHSKQCDKESYLKNKKMFNACETTRVRVEGSPLGVYLRDVAIQQEQSEQ